MDTDTYTARRRFGQEPALRPPRTYAQPGAQTERGMEPRRPRPAEEFTQLADALRATRRAYARHLADLLLGDVEPADDWADWYAGYLLSGK